jgi:hypothetical protein
MTIFFAALVWWVVAAILLVWHSPIRHTNTWAVATTTAVTLGVAATVGWSWYVRVQDVREHRAPAWLWISAILWIIAMISAPPVGNYIPQPTNAYDIAALWYQVIGFAGTLIVFIQRFWGNSQLLREMFHRRRVD